MSPRGSEARAHCGAPGRLASCVLGGDPISHRFPLRLPPQPLVLLRGWGPELGTWLATLQPGLPSTPSLDSARNTGSRLRPLSSTKWM